MVHPYRPRQHEASDVLRRGRVRDPTKALRAHRILHQQIAPHVIPVRNYRVALLHILFLRDPVRQYPRHEPVSPIASDAIRRRRRDSREEDGPGVSQGPVLEVHPEVVPPDERLEAGAQRGAPEVLPQLDALVHCAVAVAQVGRERVSEVDAEALLRAVAC